MITKEKILEILHSHSYNVEDQAGNHLIVVDDDSWDAVATEVKNCSIPDVMHRRELLIALIDFAYNDTVCVGKEPEEVLDLFLCN